MDQKACGTHDGGTLPNGIRTSGRLHCSTGRCASFSRELLKRMEIKGVKRTDITLHIGMGHFRAVDVEDLSKHKMDSEPIVIHRKPLKRSIWLKQRTTHFASGIDVLRAVRPP